jgi:hypothetical protein
VFPYISRTGNWREHLKTHDLSAESAEQHGLGRKPQEEKALKQALKGRHSRCAAPSGLEIFCGPLPGVPEPASRAPPPRALLYRAFSAQIIGFRAASPGTLPMIRFYCLCLYKCV